MVEPPPYHGMDDGLSRAWADVSYRRMNGNTWWETTFIPRATVPGSLVPEETSGTATGGGETKSGMGTAYKFVPSATIQTQGNDGHPLIDTSWSILSSREYTWTLKPYSKTCTLTNKTEMFGTPKDLPIYDLTPPGDFTGSPGQVVNITFPKHTLKKNGSLKLGAPGIHYSPEMTSIHMVESGCGIINYARQWNPSLGEMEEIYFPPGYFMLP